MRRTLAVSLGTAAALAAFMPAGQASADGRVHVVKPGRSIQKAVDRARPGDVILLKAGRYDGGVLVRKPLTIRGAGNKTVLRPARKADHCAKAGQRGSGICVVGRAGHPVRNVTIKKISVQGFRETGVIGVHTDRLTVEHVLAKRNGEYGIAEFHSTRGRFIHNRVEHSGEHAGLYVGDIANAHGTEVAENHASGNAMGLLVRHARNVKAWNNTFVGNCTGIVLVDDGQKGGQGHTALWQNNVVKNNRNCKANGPLPALPRHRHSALRRRPQLDQEEPGAAQQGQAALLRRHRPVPRRPAAEPARRLQRDRGQRRPRQRSVRPGQQERQQDQQVPGEPLPDLLAARPLLITP